MLTENPLSHDQRLNYAFVNRQTVKQLLILHSMFQVEWFQNYWWRQSAQHCGFLLDFFFMSMLSLRCYGCKMFFFRLCRTFWQNQPSYWQQKKCIRIYNYHQYSPTHHRMIIMYSRVGRTGDYFQSNLFKKLDQYFFLPRGAPDLFYWPFTVALSCVLLCWLSDRLSRKLP